LLKTKKKQSRFKREPEKSKLLALQKRDLKVLLAVTTELFLTTEQIHKLFFPSYQVATRRLQKLWNAGYLQREFLPVITGSCPIIYCPNRLTINALLENGLIEEKNIKWQARFAKISPDKKKHEIEINDIKIALSKAIERHPDIKLIHWSKGRGYWDKVRVIDKQTGQMKYLPVCPDRFIILQKQNQKPLYIFLEHDRGTMSMGSIKNKMIAYCQYLVGQGFYKKYGKPSYPVSDYVFKVLFTVPTEIRRNKLIEQRKDILNPEIFYFIVLDKFLVDPLGLFFDL